MIFLDDSDFFPQKYGRRRIRKYKGKEVDVYLGLDYKWDSRTVKVWAVIGSDEVGPLFCYEWNINAERDIDKLKR